MESADDAPRLGSLVGGFGGHYRPTKDERTAALRTGLIVFDTNALLDLYRFVPAARAEFIEILGHVKNRIFVPYQVALEFHSNRVEAVAGRIEELTAARDTLDELANRAQGLIRRISARGLSDADESPAVVENLSNAFQQASELVERAVASYDLTPDDLAVSPTDPVLDALAHLLEGRVGARPDDETASADRREAARRAELRIPPGYSDRKKVDNAAGDYLWWAEVVRIAAATRPDRILLVSNDVGKGDWTHEVRGFRIGPALELIDEIDSASGASLFLATTGEFLSEVGEALGLAAVSPSTVAAADAVPVAAVVAAIRTAVAQADRPLVSSAVANYALQVDPSMTATAWAGTGSFRSFLGRYAPELQFVIPPQPGYVVDPTRHSESDVASRRLEERGSPARADTADVVRPSTAGSPPPVSFPAGSGAVSRETWKALQDAVAIPPDALKALQDTVAIPPDALKALQDAVAIPPETLKALHDAVAIPPDALKAVQDALAIPPETMRLVAELRKTRWPGQPS